MRRASSGVAIAVEFQQRVTNLDILLAASRTADQMQTVEAFVPHQDIDVGLSFQNFPDDLLVAAIGGQYERRKRYFADVWISSSVQ